MIVDAKDMIVGRFATKVAKAALEGKEVHVINCEDAVYSGSRDKVLEKFQRSRDRTVALKGPYISRLPERIVRRAIRGMIPYKTPKGKAAFARIKCHKGLPAEFEGQEAIRYEEASKEKLPNIQYVYVHDISAMLGGRR